LNATTSPDELPAYDELASALERCASTHTPSEAQGFALGLLMAGVEEPYVSWELELYSDFDPTDVLAGECRALLDQLFETTAADLGSSREGLQLLLPQDILVNQRRLSAVRDWCQGFLYGFGLAGDGLLKKGSEQMQDLLRDIAEITRLQVEDDDNSAENQEALIEIEEYLRVGVMLLRDELTPGEQSDDAR
jgi:yecA family protein